MEYAQLIHIVHCCQEASNKLSTYNSTMTNVLSKRPKRQGRGADHIT